MSLNLDDLEAIARAATPGTWEAGDVWVYSDPVYPDDRRLSNVLGMKFEDEERADAEHARGLRNAAHIATFDPPTVLALITRLREAERHNVQLLREAVKREARVRRAEGAIAEALNHDPLHGRKEGMHCGGMAPCIRDALTAYKPTNQEGNTSG